MFFNVPMGFFNSSQKSNVVTAGVPPEIMARISVMSDHIKEMDAPLADTDDTLRATTTIPLAAIAMPHGPFSAENTDLANAPTTSVQSVSQESAETSPFLQTLAPEALMVSEKVKPQVEAPIFLTEKNQTKQFGFGQIQSTPQALNLNQMIKNKEEGAISLQATSSPSSQKPWWMLGVFFAFLLVALGGAYYYFYVYSEKNRSLPESNLQPLPVSTISKTEKPTSEFSLISPNYLSVNVETVSKEEFRSQLESIGTKMKLANIMTPVEFFITDQANTPVAFSRFVALFSFQFPQNVVSLTEEKFSIFLFNDQGKTRIGFNIFLKGESTSEDIIKKAEGDFPIIFQNLFLESKSIPQKKYIYKESLHNGKKIRYINISEPELLSFDYSLNEKNWFIGTSKNTLRAILDMQKK